MSVNYSTAAKNAKLDAVNTYIGTGGKLQFYTAAYGSKLVEWTFTGNAFAAPSGGTMTSNAAAVDPITPLANGTVALARFTKADGTTIVVDGLTVGTSATDFIVSSTSILTTQPQDLGAVTINEV
jgi:hypothetical protein